MAAHRLAGKKILVAENFSDISKMMQNILSSEGALVEFAGTGADVVARWGRGETLDLILMDLEMPIMDGYNTIGHLRRNRYRGPILSLTPQAVDSDMGKCFEAGFDGYITKPIRKDEMIRCISFHVHRNATALSALTDEIPFSGALVSSLVDDDIVRTLIPQFSVNLSRYVGEIESFAKNADWPSVKTLAHQLKGTGGGYGFPAVSEIAGQLERVVADSEIVPERVFKLSEKLFQVSRRIERGLHTTH